MASWYCNGTEGYEEPSRGSAPHPAGDSSPDPKTFVNDCPCGRWDVCSYDCPGYFAEEVTSDDVPF